VGELRALLKGKPLEKTHIHVPLASLEPAMKSGKVVFPWKEVVAWIKPALNLPSTPAIGEINIEFPLKVIAPLFMAHHRGATQKRIAVDETIPDLFGGGGGNSSMQAQIAPSTSPAPVRAATAAAPATNGLRMSPASVAAPAEVKPAPLVTSAAPAASMVPDVERIIGGPGKRFSPKEIVLNTSRLPGVSGALLSMNDGLLVTGQTPPSMKPENIAAFIPQMFGRMNQYTKELALGPLQQLTLTVEAGQWHVLKRDSIYFAVLGKGGEPLPLNLLAQIAAELSSQSN
jgi:predicted regulator of Ras-like GTPase activity (Roadblock/LC7/MglB family)